MLQIIRSKVGSWVVKILFAVLIASFAVWGIGDLFRDRGPDQTVAEVGDIEISLQAVNSAFQNDVNQMRQIFGPEFGAEQAISMGMLDQTVERLVNGAVLDNLIAQAGIAPSQEAVAQTISREPMFQGASGSFDAARFQQVLGASGLTEGAYVALLRNDLARQQIIGAVSAGAEPPTALVSALHRYRDETRTATLIPVPLSAVEEIPEPSEEELQSFYEANPALFEAPEYRVLTVASLSAADLAEGESVGEDLVRAEYDARIDEFETPEMRAFDQVVVEDQETAARIAEAAREAGSFQAGLDALENTEASVIALESAPREEMLPQLAEAGFALEEGGVSEPVESPFGWHVLAVTEIAPGGTVPFEEARAEIEQDLKLESALDSLFEIANQIEDGLAGGSGLDEIATQFGLETVTTPPVAQDGSTRDDAEMPDLPAQGDVLTEAFQLAEGETSRLTDTADGVYFLVRTDEIIEPQIRPIEEVRTEVPEAWRAAERDRMAQEIAADVAERLAAGDDPATIAGDQGLPEPEIATFHRDGSDAGDWPTTLVDALFAAEAGDTATVPMPEDGHVAALLTDITVPEATDDAAAEALAAEAETAIGNDLAAQFTEALRREVGVEIHRDTLEQFYRQG